LSARSSVTPYRSSKSESWLNGIAVPPSTRIFAEM
jgi:hypothetical protein